jgi:hypothetical protein
VVLLAQAADPATIFDYISQGGAVAVLVWIVLGAVREWWFPAAAYRRLERDRDEWKEIALRGVKAADKAVTLVERP